MSFVTELGAPQGRRPDQTFYRAGLAEHSRAPGPQDPTTLGEGGAPEGSVADPNGPLYVQLQGPLGHQCVVG